jgi:hypothetical protein
MLGREPDCTHLNRAAVALQDLRDFLGVRIGG